MFHSGWTTNNIWLLYIEVCAVAHPLTLVATYNCNESMYKQCQILSKHGLRSSFMFSWIFYYTQLTNWDLISVGLIQKLVTQWCDLRVVPHVKERNKKKNNVVTKVFLHSLSHTNVWTHTATISPSFPSLHFFAFAFNHFYNHSLSHALLEYRRSNLLVWPSHQFVYMPYITNTSPQIRPQLFCSLWT